MSCHAPLDALAAYTKARLHVAHLSSARAVELIRAAKASGVAVTCDVSLHHLAFVDAALHDYDSNLRLSPPLRQTHDRDALIASYAAYRAGDARLEDAILGVVVLELTLRDVDVHLGHHAQPR